MKIPQKLIKFLGRNKIKYGTISHRTVYTAQDKAATLKVKPSVVGKTLILKVDKELAIVLIPGNKNLDKNKFKKVSRAKKIDFISERVMKNKFKGFKIGALPPFGEIFKIPTFVDKLLLKEKNVFVNSGIYEASLKVSPKIFDKTENIKGDFSKSK